MPGALYVADRDCLTRHQRRRFRSTPVMQTIVLGHAQPVATRAPAYGLNAIGSVDLREEAG
jgi:hypothetical protein